MDGDGSEYGPPVVAKAHKAGLFAAGLPGLIGAHLDRLYGPNGWPEEADGSVADRANQYPRPLQPAGPIPCLTPGGDPDGSERAVAALLAGRIARQLLFAGAATRAAPLMGGEAKFFFGRQTIDENRPAVLAALDALGLDRHGRERFALQAAGLDGLPLGVRHLLSLRTGLADLARGRGVDPGAVLARQWLVVHVNRQSADRVVEWFARGRFFGFDPARTLFVVQPNLPSFALENGRLTAPADAPSRPVGHGYTLMQLGWPGEAFRSGPDGRPGRLDTPVLSLLEGEGADFLANTNIDDLAALERGVDPDRTAAALRLLDAGADLAVEVVENRKKQKGGVWVRDPRLGRDLLVEGLQLKIGHERLFGADPPLNRMANTFRVAAVRAVLRDRGLPAHLDVRDGRLSVELVTGDLSGLPGIVPAAYCQPGSCIRTFKSPADVAELVAVMAGQQLQPGYREAAEGVA